MSTQQTPETEVVSGQVVGVITKPNDKWQIEISTGGQYTRRLWTKDASLVSQMQAAVGQSFDFICGVSHWQGQTGPVRSLWINSVALFGTTPGQAIQTSNPVATQQQIQNPDPLPVIQQPVIQGMPTISPMEKEERIMREHAMSVAATMLPHMHPDERNAQGMITVAEGLIAYYKLGPGAINGNPGDDPTPTQRNPHPGAYDEPNVEQSIDQLVQDGLLEETPPVPEDDIPF